QDGVTQDCFLSQLQFKLVAGILIFVVLRLAFWKFQAGRLRAKTLVWTTALTLVVALAFAGLGTVWRHAQDGPVVKGKSVGQWISEASLVPDATDPSVLALRELGTAALLQVMKAFKEGKSQFYWFGSLSEPSRWD